jgi:hypothetical protein
MFWEKLNVFLYILMPLSATQVIVSNDKMIGSIQYVREWSWPYAWYYPGIYLQGPKTHEEPVIKSRM